VCMLQTLAELGKKCGLDLSGGEGLFGKVAALSNVGGTSVFQLQMSNLSISVLLSLACRRSGAFIETFLQKSSLPACEKCLRGFFFRGHLVLTVLLLVANPGTIRIPSHFFEVSSHASVLGF
jgi:hypothetical protein